MAEEVTDVEAVYGDIHFVNDSDLTRCVRYYSSAGFSPWKMKMGFMPAHPSFYCRREVYLKYGLLIRLSVLRLILTSCCGCYMLTGSQRSIYRWILSRCVPGVHQQAG